MLRSVIELATLGLVLAACALTPQGACGEQGLSEGSAAYDQCVADKTAAASQYRTKRVRHGHGR